MMLVSLYAFDCLSNTKYIGKLQVCPSLLQHLLGQLASILVKVEFQGMGNIEHQQLSTQNAHDQDKWMYLNRMMFCDKII